MRVKQHRHCTALHGGKVNWKVNLDASSFDELRWDVKGLLLETFIDRRWRSRCPLPLFRGNWGPRPFIYNPWWAAASWAEDERKLRRCCIIRQFDRRRRRRLHPPTWNIRSFCCCCCSTVRQEKISSRCTHAIWSERVCIHQSPKGTRPGPVWPRVILTIDPWLALPLRIDEQVPRSSNPKVLK